MSQPEWKPQAKGSNYLIQLHIQELSGAVWHVYAMTHRDRRHQDVTAQLNGQGDPDIAEALKRHALVGMARLHGPLPLSKPRLRGYLRWVEHNCRICDAARPDKPMPLDWHSLGQLSAAKARQLAEAYAATPLSSRVARLLRFASMNDSVSAAAHPETASGWKTAGSGLDGHHAELSSGSPRQAKTRLPTG